MAARTELEDEESDSPLLRNQLSIPPSIPLLKQKSEMPKLSKLRDESNMEPLHHSVTPDNMIVSNAKTEPGAYTSSSGVGKVELNVGPVSSTSSQRHSKVLINV